MVEAKRVRNELKFECSCDMFFERTVCAHIVALSIMQPYEDTPDFGIQGFEMRGRRALGRRARAAGALIRQ